MSFLIWLLLAAHSPWTWAAQSESSGHPTRPRPVATSASRAQGTRDYLQRCAACHGRRGDGRGWALKAQLLPPRDFTAGVFKLRSTPSGSVPTDEDLFATISRGMHGTVMLPWRGLPEPERWGLVDRVKAFSVRFDQEQPAAPVVVPTEPPVSDALVAEGGQLWQHQHCGACHGTGKGRGPEMSLFRKDAGPAARLRDLGRGEFLRGMSARDIYLTLRTGLDGTSMRSYAQALSPDDTWALAAFVRSLLPASAVQ